MDDILDAAQKKSEDATPSPSPVDNHVAGSPPPDPLPSATKTEDTPLLDDPPILSSPLPTTPIQPDVFPEKLPEPKVDTVPSVLAVSDSLSPPTDQGKIISAETEEVKPPEPESPPANDIFTVPPSPPKKSGKGRGVLIATLLFFILTLPIAVYFVSNPQQLADLRNWARLPTDEGCGPYPCPTSTPQPPAPTATPTTAPAITPTPTGKITGYPCCDGPGDNSCASDETCRINNGACATGWSCGKIACLPNGSACTPQTAGICCSGGCDTINNVCYGGANVGTCPLNASQVCQQNGSADNSSQALTCAPGGQACVVGGSHECCYGDAANSCRPNSSGGTSGDGSCYGGQGKVSCGGGTITNNTTGPITIGHYTRPSGSCPSTSFVNRTTLLPGQSERADDCEQIDAAGYCGQCNPNCSAGGGTPNPTPTPTGVIAQCLRIKVYKDNQVVATLSTLKPGDNVVLSVAGSNATKGRIRVFAVGVPSGAWTETTTRNTAGEFTTPFTIPASITTFTIEAEVYRDGVWQ